MKTEEFEKRLDELGCKGLGYDTVYKEGESVSNGFIIVSKEKGNALGTVHKVHQYDIQVFPTEEMSDELFELITEYAKTPKEER